MFFCGTQRPEKFKHCVKKKRKKKEFAYQEA